jgi:quinoprotein glucose dehydrogenase
VHRSSWPRIRQALLTVRICGSEFERAKEYESKRKQTILVRAVVILLEMIIVRLAILTLSAVCCLAQSDFRGWPVYGGSSENIHYSSLKQINTTNVQKLKVAWVYESGDAYPGSDIEANPIVVDGVLFAITPKLRVVALQADSGKQIWSFDPLNGGRPTHKSRGLTYWKDGDQARIFFAVEHELLSINATTGELDSAFGKKGRVDMREAFDRPLDQVVVSVRNPGVIYRDLIVLGSTVSERLPSTPGDIRAYDVRTGKLRWTFHTIPRPGEIGHETWPPDAWKTSGGANNWAGLAVDVKRGFVYVPTGSAAFDFYGADRHGDNLFANSVICLDAATGKRKWHYQAVKHDVWDMDFPTAPLLVTVRHKGRLVDAVAQAGKDGYVYVLNRETGESLFPIEDRSVPVSTVDGELLARSQKIPLKPAPFVRQEFTEETVTRRTEAAHDAVLQQLRGMDHGPRFTPPSTRGTVVFPGFAGGAEWGGGAYDPETHIYYINANEIAYILRLLPYAPMQRRTPASAIYRSRCASCHGADKKGSPPDFPALDSVAGAMTEAELSGIIRKGNGRMPSFASLGEPAIGALSDLLLQKKDGDVMVEEGKQPVELKYTMDGYKTFTDPDGYPASTPPWGSLSAINLDTGEYVWKTALGEYPELAAKGMKDTGTENHGGGVVTAGGLFFIGATHYDRKFRAFDKKTGKLLWETELPHAGNATPAVYEIKGKQYVVIPAGGGRSRPSGGSFVAFALP